MGSHVWRLGVVCLLALGTFAGVEAQNQSVQPPLRVAELMREQTGPRSDGTFVVWEDWLSGDPMHSIIRAARLDTGEELALPPTAIDGSLPDVDDGTLVWSVSVECPTCARDIVGVNLNNNEDFIIADSPADENGAVISDDLVVWVETSENGQFLMGQDLNDDAGPFEIAEASPTGRPELHGDRIVWSEIVQPSGRSEMRWQLFTMRIGETEPTVLAEGTSIGAGGSFGFDVAGDVVVYVDTFFEIVVHDLSTGQTKRLPGVPYNQNPTTDGQTIVWMSYVDTGDGNPEFGLLGYDIQTGATFTVAANMGEKGGPHLHDGVLVWSQHGEGGSAVYAADTSELRTEPLGPNARYFPETGHYLDGIFGSFWDQNGGLPVFGYPLTEEFVEQNVDTGTPRTVQYFERQRYEYHPENAGTPYEVLLGRLGVTDATNRGLLETHTAFDPLPDGTEAGADCLMFTETSHQLCDQFLDYWQAHGLEMGDPGVSYRESLALFGYPISEPFVLPGTDLLVQYFERARLEWHPDNPAPYTVLGGRLGADMLTERE